MAAGNAQSASDDHRKSFFVLNRGHKGFSKAAIAGVLAESWFTRPTKGRNSDLVAGVGKLEIASVIDPST